uniref:ORF47h n=1 Tax=Pinus koraiensis TaxID=88728 RepID=Q85X28_PINKO|nr:ORF47h [Pinus koraiensis]AAO74037.1 ORF47h [Pinus koraiensis]
MSSLEITGEIFVKDRSSDQDSKGWILAMNKTYVTSSYSSKKKKKMKK